MYPKDNHPFKLTCSSVCRIIGTLEQTAKETCTHWSTHCKSDFSTPQLPDLLYWSSEEAALFLDKNIIYREVVIASICSSLFTVILWMGWWRWWTAMSAVLSTWWVWELCSTVFTVQWPTSPVFSSSSLMLICRRNTWSKKPLSVMNNVFSL